MDNQQKEEKLDQTLKHPKPSTLHSKEIASLINTTIRNKHNVYVCTDWHLFKRKEKDKPECNKSPKFDKIISKFKEVLEPEDLLINLGDLSDGELEDPEKYNEIKEAILSIPGKKVLVKGNNDVKDAAFYKSCGFKHVVNAFVWSNVIFTHMPVENAFDLNIHGHIHGCKRYWIPYTNQIDAAAFNGREEPVELLKLLRSQPIYAKGIKEEPEHFNETFSIFDEIMNKRVQDPFPYEDEEE